jgi:hypothetical protein
VIRKLVSIAIVLAAAWAFAAPLPSFNATQTYDTITDYSGRVFAVQNGVYYDQQGNAFSALPQGPGGYIPVSAGRVNPRFITLNGAVPATLTNPALQVTNSVDNYTQVSIQNKSATANASADIVAYPDNVTSSDLTGYMDMGITSSVFSQAAYAVTGANEGYLFMSAPSGAGKSGNMVIATDSTGSANNIVFATNGFGSAANRHMVIFGSGRVSVGGTTDDGVNELQVTGSGVFSTGLKSATMNVGATQLALSGSALGIDRMVASGSAPGAAGGKLEMICGTNAGSAKLVMYAGTSGSSVTVVDNVGAGVTGC